MWAFATMPNNQQALVNLSTLAAIQPDPNGGSVLWLNYQRSKDDDAILRAKEPLGYFIGIIRTHAVIGGDV